MCARSSSASIYCRLHRLDHEDDYRAIHFMVESSPPELQYRIARCKTAYEAYQFIKDKYVGGKDAAYVRELEDKFAKLKMLSSEILEMYIHRAEEIGLRLDDNKRSPYLMCLWIGS